MKTIALLATGDELVLGHVADQNLHWLAKTLHDRHHHVGTHVLCGDQYTSIVQSLHHLCQHHDTIIMTGGLGPTSDDITRGVIADYLEKPLTYHHDVFEYVHRHRTQPEMPVAEQYLAQFYFPAHAVLFKNHVGTAWGFACCHHTQPEKQCWIYVLPGPPIELQTMFLEVVWPHFSGLHKPIQYHHLQWHVVGMDESILHDRLLMVFAQQSITMHICAKSNRRCHVYIYLDVQSNDVLQCRKILVQVANVLVALNARFTEHHTILEG